MQYVRDACHHFRRKKTIVVETILGVGGFPVKRLRWFDLVVAKVSAVVLAEHLLGFPLISTSLGPIVPHTIRVAVHIQPFRWAGNAKRMQFHRFRFFDMLHAAPLIPRILTKQREEAQERAQKAFEEKSAEVKREKEALSKKQELETARAAEEAEQSRKQAEQERQARMSVLCVAGYRETYNRGA